MTTMDRVSNVVADAGLTASLTWVGGIIGTVLGAVAFFVSKPHERIAARAALKAADAQMKQAEAQRLEAIERAATSQLERFQSELERFQIELAECTRRHVESDADREALRGDLRICEENYNEAMASVAELRTEIATIKRLKQDG